MNIDEIRDEITFRKEADYDARFDPLVILDSIRTASVVKRNDWQGVTMGEGIKAQMAVPTIFDSVKIIEMGTNIVAEVSIEDKQGAYQVDGISGEIIPCEYDEIIINPFSDSIIFKQEGLEGLYSVRLRRKVFECEYASVSFNSMTRFIWAQKINGTFLVCDTQTGSVNTLPTATKVFETEGGILYSDKDNYVHFVNTDGLTDPLSFRRKVIASGGRLRLQNSRIQTECVCDITGYIIND